MESIVIPRSVTTLGAGVFSYCKSLTTVTFLGDLKSVGSNLFDHCPAISYLVIPQGRKAHFTALLNNSRYAAMLLEQ